MENTESKFPNIGETRSQNIQEDFSRLKSIAEILRGMGFQVIDNLITVNRLQDPTSEIGFPIVRDGVDGIRASYSKRKGLKVWFTNGFEDPADLKRQEVEKQLKDAGLI